MGRVVGMMSESDLWDGYEKNDGHDGMTACVLDAVHVSSGDCLFSRKRQPSAQRNVNPPKSVHPFPAESLLVFSAHRSLSGVKYATISLCANDTFAFPPSSPGTDVSHCSHLPGHFARRLTTLKELPNQSLLHHSPIWLPPHRTSSEPPQHTPHIKLRRRLLEKLRNHPLPCHSHPYRPEVRQQRPHEPLQKPLNNHRGSRRTHDIQPVRLQQRPLLRSAPEQVTSGGQGPDRSPCRARRLVPSAGSFCHR